MSDEKLDEKHGSMDAGFGKRKAQIKRYIQSKKGSRNVNKVK